MYKNEHSLNLGIVFLSNSQLSRESSRMLALAILGEHSRSRWLQSSGWIIRLLVVRLGLEPVRLADGFVGRAIRCVRLQDLQNQRL